MTLNVPYWIPLSFTTDRKYMPWGTLSIDISIWSAMVGAFWNKMVLPARSVSFNLIGSETALFFDRAAPTARRMQPNAPLAFIERNNEEQANAFQQEESDETTASDK